jgi:hypothetical protein
LSLFYLKKMRTELEKGRVRYFLTSEDQVEHDVNQWIGKTLRISHLGKISCVNCQRPLKKTMHEGYCYPCFMKLAACDSCVMRPHTCHFHLGTCREPEWGLKNCFIPHYLYLAKTSSIKVGLTKNVPHRWMDQGATEAQVIGVFSSRKEAGLAEEFLKTHYADRTNFRAMLKGTCEDDRKLNQEVERSRELLESFEFQLETLTLEIGYPGEGAGAKIKSIQFNPAEETVETLIGIRGQYLIFASGVVVNIRKHTGHFVTIKML